MAGSDIEQRAQAYLLLCCIVALPVELQVLLLNRDVVLKVALRASCDAQKRRQFYDQHTSLSPAPQAACRSRRRALPQRRRHGHAEAAAARAGAHASQAAPAAAHAAKQAAEAAHAAWPSSPCPSASPSSPAEHAAEEAGHGVGGRRHAEVALPDGGGQAQQAAARGRRVVVPVTSAAAAAGACPAQGRLVAGQQQLPQGARLALQGRRSRMGLDGTE